MPWLLIFRGEGRFFGRFTVVASTGRGRLCSFMAQIDPIMSDFDPNID
jgi:hypothetical protein